jgi:hypothetical protein
MSYRDGEQPPTRKNLKKAKRDKKILDWNK